MMPPKERSPTYFSERRFGHCRSLVQAPLAEASLYSAVLYSAVLRSADLSSANLRDAVLRDADLSCADLSNAILLATNFRNLTPEQFTPKNPPVICPIALPQHILEAGIDPDRDCDRLPQILSDRYGRPLEEAQQEVERARQKTWDEPTDTPTK